MGYESFIARRYMRSGQLFVTVSTWITILGVMLGVAVVCIVMSVHNGFESEIRTRLLGTTSHITIFPFNNEYISNYNELVDTIESVNGVEAASAFIYYKVAISSASNGDGIIIRGINIEQEKKTSQIIDNVMIGDCSFDPIIDENDTIPGMIIGSSLADRLGVFLGSSVFLYSLKGEDLQRNSRPRVAKFYISGILETGMYDFDAQMAYISLESAQKLFRTGDAATTIHLKLEDVSYAPEISKVIDSTLGYRYDIVPWYELHRNLFEWIEIEKMVLFIGFILIVLVAAFSIISTLVLLTMEKRGEIGILKTMGSTPFSIVRIFVSKGLSIATYGVVLGWALAILSAYLQNQFQIVTVPADIYFISFIPVEIHPIDFVITGGATFFICFLASIYPAYQASRVSVIEVLRK